MKFYNLIYLIIFNSCIAFAQSNEQLTPHREMRAAWVATVENIDWPSSKYLSTEQKKKEFTKIVRKYSETGFNALFVQIRPCADAFYPSPYEPYSRYIFPQSNDLVDFDPLQFMIDECHHYGLEFHAWFNPYRAVINIQYDKSNFNHITKLKPEWFLTYGTIKLFNPGLPEVWNYIKEVIMDVVKKYDIDGVHLDDYFYPYKIPGKVFPDQKTYLMYGAGMTRDDWRRKNVDTVIQLLHHAIKKEKPYIQFGVSPFGVWRNKSTDPIEGSNTRAGQTNYDDLYADILKWLKNDWIDYAAPQLYWEIGNKLCDYNTLVSWWSNHHYGKYIYVGHASYRLFEKTSSWNNSNQLLNQIKIARGQSNICGSVFYNTNSMMKNPHGIMDSLKNNLYQKKCLTPIKQIRKNWYYIPQSMSYNQSTKTLSITADSSIRFIGIYYQGFLKGLTNDWNNISLNEFSELNKIEISFIDKFGNETKPISID